MTTIIHRDNKSTHDETRDNLLKELKYLRSVVRDVGEGFIIRKESEIETLLNSLDELTPRVVKQISKVWLKELRSLPVKPAKGRLKDLKKIDILLKELLDTIEETQEIPRPNMS